MLAVDDSDTWDSRSSELWSINLLIVLSFREFLTPDYYHKTQHNPFKDDHKSCSKNWAINPDSTCLDAGLWLEDHQATTRSLKSEY